MDTAGSPSFDLEGRRDFDGVHDLTGKICELQLRSPRRTFGHAESYANYSNELRTHPCCQHYTVRRAFTVRCRMPPVSAVDLAVEVALSLSLPSHAAHVYHFKVPPRPMKILTPSTIRCRTTLMELNFHLRDEH